MLRRPVVFVVALVLAAALVPSALAVGFRVRVEGRTQTIFGPTEPRLDLAAARVTALDALEAASVSGEFYYRVQQSTFGAYVVQIGRFPAGGTAGWVYKVNGVSPPVGASDYVLKEGDRVLWYYAQFGVVPGGPETLLLRRARGRCYRVVAQNDQGRERVAEGATLRVGGRRYRTRGGRACLPRHNGLVRAELAGAIRSNAVR